jgi:hypothetical protein
MLMQSIPVLSKVAILQPEKSTLGVSFILMNGLWAVF